MTWKSAFKRATATITVGVVALLLFFLGLQLGYGLGSYSCYPDYLSPQKGEMWQTPEFS